jgi:tetratricopeptide (TPR) repeat protein
VLEARGHTLMQEGEYAAAIPVLQQAIAAAAPGSLTYAYALFDLGRSLRLAGDPQAAIPILWRRLRIPNATDVVRTELELALRAIGVREMHRRQAGQGPPGHEHGRGGGHDHSDGTSQDD